MAFMWLDAEVRAFAIGCSRIDKEELCYELH